MRQDEDARATLTAELADATAELPMHWQTNARADLLLTRCRSLNARLAEHEP